MYSLYSWKEKKTKITAAKDKVYAILEKRCKIGMRSLRSALVSVPTLAVEKRDCLTGCCVLAGERSTSDGRHNA